MRFFHLLRCLVSICLISVSICLGWIQPVFAGNAEVQTDVVKQQASRAELLCKDTGQKIDLNNANLIAFMDCPGFYPDLARSIVQQGPYDQIEDVLSLPDISDRQKQLLQTNLHFFTVSTPIVPIEMRMPPRPSMRANP